MKLFAIGDSITQGFMSLAAARTEHSYATLLAKKLGLIEPGKPPQYVFPEWKQGGIPLNLEEIMRALTKRYGSNIAGIEWLTVLQTINSVVDLSEDYYERGEGRAELAYSPATPYFHNLAVRGFDVADAWLVTPEACRRELRLDKGGQLDGYLSGPSLPFYRTALKVLNPTLNPKYDQFSAISWLEHHAKGEGIENLILWLGANNALGTVVSLQITQTPNNERERPHTLSHIERAKVRRWNLWHPDDFRAEYEELLQRVDKAMLNNKQDWKVFVGTVPLVTIPPLAKGVGPTTRVKINDGGESKYETYYKYYTYFPFEEDFIAEANIYLTMQDVQHIDACVRSYNDIIRELVREKNVSSGHNRYIVVDVASALEKIAIKRNAGNPTYDYPDYFEYVYPKVNTKYYHADKNRKLKQGGLFGLDGIHPSVIGHGLIAYEFLKEMQKVGVVADTKLDWKSIFEDDRLYSDPIPLMHLMYDLKDFAKQIIKLIQLFKD